MIHFTEILIKFTRAALCFLLSALPVFLPGQNAKSYDEMWLEVGRLRDDGLTESALSRCDDVIKKAVAEGNSAQHLKGLIHRIYFVNQREEDSFLKAISEMEKLAASAEVLLSAVASSATAELYWWYYQNNRWTILERTELKDKTGDITTWTAGRIIEKIGYYYGNSIINKEALQKTGPEVFDPVWLKGQGGRILRPTLYDVLIHRAIDFYSNGEAGIAIPSDQFRINRELYFSPASSFVAARIVSGDRFSFELKSLELYQSLLAFHLESSNEDALVYNDLERLKYVKGKYSGWNGDSLFERALDSLAGGHLKCTVSAEVLYEKALLKFNRGSLPTGKTGKWLLKEAREICENVIAAYPGSTGAAQCEGLAHTITQPVFEVKTEKVVQSGSPFLISLNYKNLSKLHFRLIGNNRRILVEHASDDIVADVPFYAAMKPFREWSVELPDSGDHQNHSIELHTGGVENGYYALLVSMDGEFSSSENLMSLSYFYSSSLAYFILQQQNGKSKVLVTERQSGKALQGIPAILFTEQYNYSVRGRDLIRAQELITDKDGIIQLPSDVQGRNYHILFRRGDDSIKTENAVYVREWNDTKRKAVPLSAIFTDRAVYRPGQLVYFKGILMEREGFGTRILPSRGITVKLFDMNQQECGRLELTTSEFGSYSGSFVMPPSAMTGHFTIDDGVSRHTVLLEEYKRPTFTVEVLQPGGNIRLGDTVHVKGKALTINGVLLDGAKGSYHVVRRGYNTHPIREIYPYPFRSDAEIASGTLLVGQDGNFSLKFAAIPEPGMADGFHESFSFRVDVIISDLSGESQAGSTEIVIGNKSLEIGMIIGDEINAASLGSVPVYSRNLMGYPTPARLRMKVIRLVPTGRYYKDRIWDKPEYHSLGESQFSTVFPFNDYGDTDNTLMDGLTITDTVFSCNGIDTFSLAKLRSMPASVFRISLESMDPYGQEVKWERRVTLFSEADKKIARPAFLWTTSLKKTVESGGKYGVLIASSYEKARVYCIRSNKYGVKQELWLDIGNNLRRFEFIASDDDIGVNTIWLYMVAEGRLYSAMHEIEVPDRKKTLNLELITTRNILRPGDRETWKIIVSGQDAQKTEILASMYDKSLDVFGPNKWRFTLHDHPKFQSYLFHGNAFGASQASLFHHLTNRNAEIPGREFDRLNWFGFGYYGGEVLYMMDAGGARQANENTPEGNKTAEPAARDKADSYGKGKIVESKDVADQPEGIRKKTNEGAFFYPELHTDSAGSAEFSFTLPEALTSWHFQAFAHTADLKNGMITAEFTARKEIMVSPNFPRFITAGDTVEISARISNLTGGRVTLNCGIRISDPVTLGEVSGLIDGQEVSIVEVDSGRNAEVRWKIRAPSRPGMLEISVFGRGVKHSDGESRTVPVLSRSLPVTETFPLSLRPSAKKEVHIPQLDPASIGKDIRPERLAVEFTPNPAWYVVQTLPYLADPGDESFDQVFNRYFANSMALNIISSNEKIIPVFRKWQQDGGQALASQLDKNPEFKGIVLSETPWLLEAKDEAADKSGIAAFFDGNNIRNNLSTALFELLRAQLPNGGWPWFRGMQDNRYITQQIVAGLGRLGSLGINTTASDHRLNTAILRAIAYSDRKMAEDYNELKRKPGFEKENHLAEIHILALYSRTFYPDAPVTEGCEEALHFFRDQARTYWLSRNKYMQAMTALTFFRTGEEPFARKILESLRQNALHSDEFGMYWKKEVGYNWFESDIEKQAMLIEAFTVMGGSPVETEEMKLWLLRQKQVRRWKTGRATAEACYALLMKGKDLLDAGNSIEVSVGADKFLIPGESGSEAGTSYSKLTWEKMEISTEMKDIVAENKGRSTAWGAVYFQYFRNADEVGESGGALSLNRELYVKRYGSAGAYLEKAGSDVSLRTGDVVVVRLILKADRDFEFIHLKDGRAAGLEPVKQTSSYEYSVGGGYYRSVRDASLHMYFPYLARGSYVLEYELRASCSGRFSAGIATAESFYSPEFSAHSRGQRIIIGN